MPSLTPNTPSSLTVTGNSSTSKTLTGSTPGSLTLTVISASSYAGFYPSSTTYPSSTLYPGGATGVVSLTAVTADALTLTPA